VQTAAAVENKKLHSHMNKAETLPHVLLQQAVDVTGLLAC
jgi:hypothetical protein